MSEALTSEDTSGPMRPGPRGRRGRRYWILRFPAPGISI